MTKRIAAVGYWDVSGNINWA